MRIVIPQWQGRVSPVFDVAVNLLLIDIEEGRDVRNVVGKKGKMLCQKSWNACTITRMAGSSMRGFNRDAFSKIHCGMSAGNSADSVQDSVVQTPNILRSRKGEVR